MNIFRLLLVLVALTAGQVYANEVSCVISSNQQDKVVFRANSTKAFYYAGFEVDVYYSSGLRQDRQSFLSMRLGDSVSQTYDVSKKSLYKLTIKDIELQCLFGKIPVSRDSVLD